MLFKSVLLWASTAVSLCTALPGQEIFERAGPACNADNCLRAFRAASPSTRTLEASAFCSSYLSTSVQPVTVIVSTTATETPPPVFTTTTAPAVTSTSVISTFTLTRTYIELKKRELAYPAYASQCSAQGTTSQAARVSSACSCLILGAPLTKATTLSATVTAPGITSVVTTTPTTTTTTTSYTSTRTQTVLIW